MDSLEPPKPIEPGCVALVVGFIGGPGIVTVGNLIESIVVGTETFSWPQNRVWEIDAEIFWVSDMGRRVLLYACPEKFLIRIDDDENQQTFHREAAKDLLIEAAAIVRNHYGPLKITSGYRYK